MKESDDQESLGNSCRTKVEKGGESKHFDDWMVQRVRDKTQWVRIVKQEKNAKKNSMRKKSVSIQKILDGFLKHQITYTIHFV